jgi:sugar/nucleoside kinase (ribokinase family)
VSNNTLKAIIPAIDDVSVADMTGAGDQFAAGFLYGYTQKLPMEKCGELGARAAAEVIAHVGPRPLIDYKDFL